MSDEDTCARGGIRHRGSDQTAHHSTTTVVPIQSVTAREEPAHGNVVDSHFGSRESHKFQVRCSEADVGSPISSAGKKSQQGNWFEFGTGCQVMLAGPGGQTTRTCAKDPEVAKLEKTPRVYWLPGSATECTAGAPFLPDTQSGKADRQSTDNLCERL